MAEAKSRIVADPLSLTAAVIGGTLGYFAFFWIADQGFYALVLPGGLMGLAAGIPGPRSRWVAIVCGIAAVLLGLYTEWRYAPFIADDSWMYFLTHIHQLRPLTLIMILVGAAIGFWVPFRRVQ